MQWQGYFQKLIQTLFFSCFCVFFPLSKWPTQLQKKWGLFIPAILKKKRLFVLRLFLVVYGVTTLRKSLHCKYYENVSKTMRKIWFFRKALR